MYRTSFLSSVPSPPPSTCNSWARLIIPIALWISVCVCVRYGYYGNYNLTLGPNSSRMIEITSIFVEEIQVRDKSEKGLDVFTFLQKPGLTREANWSLSKYLFVRPYCRQGFSLWLNEGSKLAIKWTFPANIPSSEITIVLIKGDQNFETLLPYPTHLDYHGFANLTSETVAAEYTVEEDNNYYVGIVNMAQEKVVITMMVNITSKIYDITGAINSCSTIKICRLNLSLPAKRYLVVSTSNINDGAFWFVELSFTARLVTYIVILGFVGVTVYLILKTLGAFESDEMIEDVTVNETEPLMPQKQIMFSYGTAGEDPESGLCSSSQDLYDGKLCVICYDECRNCFLVPCGHCATCYPCAQRIAEGENKVCPICRRPIHKIRRLSNGNNTEGTQENLGNSTAD